MPPSKQAFEGADRVEVLLAAELLSDYATLARRLLPLKLPLFTQLSRKMNLELEFLQH